MSPDQGDCKARPFQHARVWFRTRQPSATSFAFSAAAKGPAPGEAAADEPGIAPSFAFSAAAECPVPDEVRFRTKQPHTTRAPLPCPVPDEGPVPNEAAADEPGTETSFAFSAYTSPATDEPGTAATTLDGVALIAIMRSHHLSVTCVHPYCATVYCVCAFL